MSVAVKPLQSSAEPPGSSARDATAEQNDGGTVTGFAQAPTPAIPKPQVELSDEEYWDRILQRATD